MANPAKKEEVEDPQIARDRVLRVVVKEWNTLIKSLLNAKVAWDKYCEVRLSENVSIEEFPAECQKVLMLANPKGDLDFILEDMITRGTHWQEFLKTQMITTGR